MTSGPKLLILAAILAFANADIIAYSGSRCDGDVGKRVSEDQCINIQDRHSFRTIDKNDYDVYASVWAKQGCHGNENGYRNLWRETCYNIDTGGNAGSMKLYDHCHAHDSDVWSGVQVWGDLIAKQCADISKHRVSKRGANDNSTVIDSNGVILEVVPETLAERVAGLQAISDKANSTGDYELYSWAQSSINRYSAIQL
ncbi:XXYS1_4_G0027450.mRNA.1.CDS.1 [Saccharomyces cerevisiae]|nr:XXYS1_4_G0027450.mRNA.1.CDS.1 [Saccharomyces cerevisiae]